MRLKNMAGYLFMFAIFMMVLCCGQGKECVISRAKMNPTMYMTGTCDADCCADLSYRYCCPIEAQVNEPVIIGFCVSVGILLIATVIIICCCYKYESKRKVIEEDEKYDQKSDPLPPKEFRYHPQSTSGHHGHPDARGYPPSRSGYPVKY